MAKPKEFVSNNNRLLCKHLEYLIEYVKFMDRLGIELKVRCVVDTLEKETMQ